MTRRIQKYVPPYDTREQHLPGYNFCGPGTNLTRRMKEGVQPIDALDRLAFEHDLVTETRGPFRGKDNPKAMRAADRKLMNGAIKLRAKGYRPRWACDTVIAAMALLLRTGARGRK